MSRPVYYNDSDPFSAAWLSELVAQNLIPHGTVDRRDIRKVRGKDVEETSHFFAGIGGWPYALELAGWPSDWPVWTGSCPCQPFSSAGNRRGTADERHLWPEFYRLIAECRPPVVFGEQVASALGRAWLAGVRADLEDLGYAVGAADLCAAGVGAPHIRQRLYWVAYSYSTRRTYGGRRQGSKAKERIQSSESVLSDGNPWPRPVPQPDPSWLVNGLSANVGAVRGFGNAIVPQVAAEFIKVFMEIAEAGMAFHIVR